MMIASARRLIVRALAYLGVGGVVAAFVVVAIACSPGAAQKRSTRGLDSERLQEIWRRYRHEDWPVQDAESGIEMRYRGMTSRFAAHYLSGDVIQTYSVIEYAFGWPFRCFGMSATVVQGANGFTETERHCLRLGGIPLVAPSSSVLIPLRPVFPGLLVNAVLYGLAAWLLVTSFAHARRAIRRRHGRCEGCGYRLLELRTCPECGRPAPPRPLAGRPANQ